MGAPVTSRELFSTFYGAPGILNPKETGCEWHLGHHGGKCGALPLKNPTGNSHFLKGDAGCNTFPETTHGT